MSNTFARRPARAPRQSSSGRGRWPGVGAILRSFARVFRRSGGYGLSSPYPVNSVLTDAAQFEALGLHPREPETFQRLADRHRYDIFVRTSHASRVANVGRVGMRPKPEALYRKTGRAPSVPGMIVYADSEIEQAKRDLAAIHHPDQLHASLAMRVLATEGLRLRPLGDGIHGVRDGAGNFFYGDIDIHGVYQRTGPKRARQVDARTFVPLFNAELTGTGLYSASLLEYRTPMLEKDFGVLPYSPIQHGAHDEWARRNDPFYAGGVNMGPLPGVIHFRPGEKPRYVSTVAHYRDILASLGQESVYTAEAWAHGRNRLAAVRYVRRDSSSTPEEPTSTRL